MKYLKMYTHVKNTANRQHSPGYTLPSLCWIILNVVIISYCIHIIFVLVNDAYKMASLCYENSEYHGAYAWFNQIYQRYRAGDKNQAEFDYTALVKDYTWSSYLVGEWWFSTRI